MVTLADVVTNLGWVLAVDNCSRGCRHCPASARRALPQRAPLYQLARTLSDLATYYTRLATPPPQWAVPCWRLSEPLDYLVRSRGGRIGTCAEVARLWRDHLHQGLYLETNGSEGRPLARRALHQIVADPGLVSQVKLTVGPADRDWDTIRYERDLATDIAILAPLWQLPSTRTEDPGGRRLRLTIRCTPNHHPMALEAVARILAIADLPAATIQQALDDGTMLAVKPLDTWACDPLRLSSHPGPRIRYGIRPDRSLFTVDTQTRTEHDLAIHTGVPVRWPLGQAATVDLNAPIATSSWHADPAIPELGSMSVPSSGSTP